MAQVVPLLILVSEIVFSGFPFRSSVGGRGGCKLIRKDDTYTFTCLNYESNATGPEGRGHNVQPELQK